MFDLTPAAIIRDLDLRKPIYRQLAAYGHMGREDLGVKWELSLIHILPKVSTMMDTGFATPMA